MRPAEIKVGKTYTNRGKGRTRRVVLGIGDEHRPDRWHGDQDKPAPAEPGVLYEQYLGVESKGTYKLYLSSFASWAGAQVKTVPILLKEHKLRNGRQMV